MALTNASTLQPTDALSTGSSVVFPWWRQLLLSIGFFGIQFAWTIQMTQTSPFLERLGSNALIMSLIWWAGPVTGVFVQPIVGALSDRTRHMLGRRRPFLFAGMVLTAFCLCVMPNSPNLLVAALMLWLLDASINITQGPYRALVPDVVPFKGQALTYGLMACFISLGAIMASLVGYAVSDFKYLFYAGVGVMLVFMGLTIVTTKEPPTVDLVSDETKPVLQGNPFKNTLSAIAALPKPIKTLCIAHSFTWFGLMCMFVFFSVFVPHKLFGATDSHSALYQQGTQYVSLCYLVFNIVSSLFSLAIGPLSNRSSKKWVHTVGLLCLAAGLIACFFITEPHQALTAMAFIGIGWATTLSVPFALLSEYIPKGQEGVMMGTFNIFIAAPQIFSSTVAGFLVYQTHNDAVALLLGGVAVAVSALLLQRFQEVKPEYAQTSDA